jgi:hypothetical protein
MTAGHGGNESQGAAHQPPHLTARNRGNQRNDISFGKRFVLRRKRFVAREPHVAASLRKRAVTRSEMLCQSAYRANIGRQLEGFVAHPDRIAQTRKVENSHQHGERILAYRSSELVLPSNRRATTSI